MKLTTVKEIYREREKYMDQEITVGGGYEAFVIPRLLDLLFSMMEHILRPFRSFTTIQWIILLRFPN